MNVDRSNVVTLVSLTYTQDAIGQQIATESTRDVYCDIQSISRAEFFDAGKNDITPDCKITMYRYDYNGERLAVVNGRRLAVYRTYVTQGELIELYLKREVGVDGPKSQH